MNDERFPVTGEWGRFLVPDVELNSIKGFGPLTNAERHALLEKTIKEFSSMHFSMYTHEGDLRLIHALGSFYQGYGFDWRLHYITTYHPDVFAGALFSYLRSLYCPEGVPDQEQENRKRNYDILFQYFICGHGINEIAKTSRLNPHAIHTYCLMAHSLISMHFKETVTGDEHAPVFDAGMARRKGFYLNFPMPFHFKRLELTEQNIHQARQSLINEHTAACQAAPPLSDRQVRTMLASLEREYMAYGIHLETSPVPPSVPPAGRFHKVLLEEVTASESLEDRLMAEEALNALQQQEGATYDIPMGRQQEEAADHEPDRQMDEPAMRTQVLGQAISISYSPYTSYGTIKSNAQIMTGILTYFSLCSYHLGEPPLSLSQLERKKSCVRNAIRPIILKDDLMQRFFYCLFVLGMPESELLEEFKHEADPDEVRMLQSRYLAQLGRFWDSYDPVTGKILMGDKLPANRHHRIRDINIWKKDGEV